MIYNCNGYRAENVFMELQRKIVCHKSQLIWTERQSLLCIVSSSMRQSVEVKGKLNSPQTLYRCLVSAIFI